MGISTRVKYIALSVLFVVATVNFTKTTLDILKSSQRLDDLKDEVYDLEKEKLNLSESIDYKKTDDYVEERARDDLNLIKPGEQVFVIVGDEFDIGDIDVLSSSDEFLRGEEKKDSNLYLWFKLFF